MPKETIRRLEENLGRVLVAGAHLAANDPELKKDQQALEKLAGQLGAKAPVLGVLAQGVARTVSSKGNAAATELVSLATQVAQVRAAQTALAPAAGSLTPLPTVDAPGTPCNARDVYELREALVTRGPGRLEKVNAALERGDIADLRLVEALIFAMADPYLGEEVTRKAVPLLGKAVVPPLRRRFNPKGGVFDARRLRALVSIEKADAKDLVVRGLREGKAAVREVAFDAVADHVPGLPELESEILEVATKERAVDVRRAAVRALAGYGSPAALEATLAALKDGGTKLRTAASEALGKSAHPQVTDRRLELLDEALAPPAEESKKKAAPKKAAKGKAAAKAPAKKDDVDHEARERVRAILDALAPHGDARAAAKARELLESHGAPAVRVVAGSSEKAVLEEIADLLLTSTDDEVFAPAVAAANKLPKDEAWRLLSAPFAAKDRAKDVGLSRVNAVLESLEAGADTRWTELLIDKALSEDAALVQPIVETLGRLGDKKAVKPLIKLLERESKSKKNTGRGVVSETIQALGELKAAEALDPILAAVAKADYGVGWYVKDAILKINDPSALDKVRDVLAAVEKQSKKSKDSWRARWMENSLRNLLGALIERFPGR